MWNNKSLKWMLSGPLSLGTRKEKRTWLSFLFQAIYLCLDLGIGLLRSYFTLAINMPPAGEGVPSFRSSYFQEFRSLIIKCTAGQYRGFHNDSSHCISTVQSCWFICITEGKEVRIRREHSDHYLTYWIISQNLQCWCWYCISAGVIQ